MPAIQLTNNTALDLTVSAADSGATLNRYLKNPLVFLTPAGFEAIASTKVESLDPNAFPLMATAEGNAQFAVEKTALDVQLGASASLGLLKGADKTDFCQTLQIADEPSPTGLVSFGIQGTVGAGPAVTVSDFSFGIIKGATVALTNFCTAAGNETFIDAAKRAIAGLTIPHDLDDLKSLPVNAICRIDAASSLQFTASVTYSFLNNALATKSIPKLPAISINATAGATLEATATHTADHTVTIAKLPNGRLHLAVSLKKTDDLETSLIASAGITAGAGGLDALAFLLDKISPNATAEMEKITAEMPMDQAEQLNSDIETAITAALCNSLQVSLKASLDNSECKKRLFVYEVDLTELNENSTVALKSALTGDFTKMTKPGTALAGIHELNSALTVTSKITHGLGLHLLGIFNWESTNIFIKQSKVDYTKDTHEIVLSDEQIKVVSDNLDAEKLREAMLKGITLTLPAAANTPEAANPIRLIFLERKAATPASIIQQFANTLQKVGSPCAVSARSLLVPKCDNYGVSSLYLGLNLTPQDCQKLFLDGGKRPYDWTYYLNHACDAAAAILESDGDRINAERVRLFRAGDAFWKKLKDAGASANQVRLLIDQGIARGAEAQIVDVDVVTFIWWSSAMGDYARTLANGEPLIGVGEKVVKASTRGFNEPWLVLATAEMLQKPSLDSRFTSSLLKVAVAGAPGFALDSDAAAI